MIFAASALGGILLNVGTLLILLGTDWARSYRALTQNPSIIAQDGLLSVVINLAASAASFASVLIFSKMRATGSVALGLAMVLVLLAFWQLPAVNLLSAILMGVSSLTMDHGPRRFG